MPAAGYAQEAQVFFCLWKAMRPQRLQAVWVLVCLLPKLLVPFVCANQNRANKRSATHQTQHNKPTQRSERSSAAPQPSLLQDQPQPQRQPRSRPNLSGFSSGEGRGDGSGETHALCAVWLCERRRFGTHHWLFLGCPLSSAAEWLAPLMFALTMDTLGRGELDTLGRVNGGRTRQIHTFKLVIKQSCS